MKDELVSRTSLAHFRLLLAGLLAEHRGVRTLTREECQLAADLCAWHEARKAAGNPAKGHS